MLTSSPRQYFTAYRSLAGIIILFLLCTGCSSRPAATEGADLSDDRRLWKIYQQVMAVRRDAEETFKNKDITPEEAEACFKRCEAALKDISRELSKLDLQKAKAYSPALRKLVKNMNKAIAVAREAYVKKRICDIKDTKAAIAAINKLSKEIPIQRTLYLIQSGCSTDQIYETFRQDGFADEDIQNYILEAMTRADQ